MKLARLGAVIALILLPLQALALGPSTSPDKLDLDLVFSQLTQAQPEPLVPPATSAPNPVTQNTVTTTGPVATTTTISVGTLASQFLMWIMTAFAPVIGSIVVWILVRVLNKLGIDATDALRARLQEFVVNGLNVSAKVAQEQIAGRGKVEIKNAIVQDAIAYTQAHGADTIKALGLDPKSGAAVEAIKARIETAINDPAVPTPAVLATVEKKV